MKFERITAADIEPGDRICYARTHTPFTVTEIGSIGEKSRWLAILVPERSLTNAAGEVVFIRQHEDRIRPRHTAKFWRVNETEAA